MAVSRRSIRFLSNGFHLTAPFSSNNTAEKGHFQLVWFQAFLLRQIVFVFCNLCTYFASVSENMKLVWWVLFMKGVFSFMKVINCKNLRCTSSRVCHLLRYTTVGTQIRWPGSLLKMAHHGLLKINFNILRLSPMYNMQTIGVGVVHFVFYLIIAKSCVAFVVPIFRGDLLLISFALD